MKTTKYQVKRFTYPLPPTAVTEHIIDLNQESLPIANFKKVLMEIQMKLIFDLDKIRFLFSFNKTFIVGLT